MTDREEAGLRGQVRICSTECDRLSGDRHWVLRTTDTFLPEGHLLEQRHRNPDGSHWATICRYDQYARILEKEQGDQRLSYHYDTFGRLERVMVHSPASGDRVYESVQYAADGTKTKTFYPIPLDQAQRKSTSISVESMLHLSLDAVAIMTLLDTDDRAIRKVLYDADDRVIRRVVFRYDERGLLLEEGELIGGAIRDDFRNVYRYDALGRRIESDKRWGDLGGALRAFAYNEHGDKAEEIIQQNSGVMTENTDARGWMQRFSYIYDEHENWIERTTETILNSGETSRSAIDRRELTYY
ncbi:MAG: hypothetical protein ABSG13_11285 [Bryobacteraceae bacterium]|jgi:hypothetical protein